jgi:hypothetical protein
LHWWCNVLREKKYSNEQSNISYSLYIHSISSLEEKAWIQIFTINLYFNSSQYYPTLDKTLAMNLSLHLICFIIRLYSCNINPHLVNLWFIFCILPRNMTVLWSVNITNGWNVHHNCFNKASHFFQLWIIYTDLCQSFKNIIVIKHHIHWSYR